MNTASEVLVIIVSSILAIFLIVLIVAGVYAVKVLKQVRRITERAENVAGTVEAAASTFGRAASPLAVLKIIGSIVEHSSKFRKRKG
jgi:heme/copper-type cytochrome/quinol oxidase subunit 2